MSCCHYYEFIQGQESVFAVDVAAIRFGAGALMELPDESRRLGMERIGIFTDRSVRNIEPVVSALTNLKSRGIEYELYDKVQIEPTDLSFKAAAQFAKEGRFDGYISLGGGSVIDTCKAAILYSHYPADFLTYVNAPIGKGHPVPGSLPPHIACPTTSGTGSECTGIAVFDLLEQQVKTGIASRSLRPSLAVIDPRCTHSLPGAVVAACGFDVMSHALESLTAIPFSDRASPSSPELRPMSQGANPWSDMGSREALRIAGRYLERAVADADDHEARHKMMYAATLAGIAFGNAGVHLPHGMSYSVAGLVRDFQPAGYPNEKPICPHGMSVIVNAPAAFRFTAAASAERHLEGAALIGGDLAGAGADDAGEVLAVAISRLMKATGMPNGISEVGYGQSDLSALAEGAFAQQRLLCNSPRPVNLQQLEEIYSSAMHYW
ncbi:MAG: hydroxyacid-oxoacid transhydrogenase [Arenicellales bacterium]|jgi:alcohol dehydrogenase class IV|nr:hydroxyacid-oxoacid transhydrogenase [Arenicellales bacterium]|tara:strand:+ start:1393 stop:2700 length:1308 start_codon:yes stop_codon:yes gene_type:complete